MINTEKDGCEGKLKSILRDAQIQFEVARDKVNLEKSRKRVWVV